MQRNHTHSTGSQSAFVTNDQQRQAYETWIDSKSNYRSSLILVPYSSFAASVTSGLSGVLQYQWGQEGLTAAPGTPVSTPPGASGVDTPIGTTGVSPNDGYSINGSG